MADADAWTQLELRITLSRRRAGRHGRRHGLGDGTAQELSRGWTGRFLPIYQLAGRTSFAARPRVAEIPKFVSAVSRGTAASRTALVEQLTAAPVQQRRKLVLDFLAQHRRGGDPTSRRDSGGDPVLRPRHGLADGRRTAAPLEAGDRRRTPATLAMDYPGSATWPTSCSPVCCASSRPRRCGPWPTGLAGHLGDRQADRHRRGWLAAFPVADPMPSGRPPAGWTPSARFRRTVSTSTVHDPTSRPGKDLHPQRRLSWTASRRIRPRFFGISRAKPSGWIPSSA